MKFILMAIAPLSMMLVSLVSKISEIIQFLMGMVAASGIGSGIWWLIKPGMDLGRLF